MAEIPTVTLERVINGERGTFGRVLYLGLQLFSAELPWRDNRPNVSCIPPGRYLVRMSFSPRFRRMTYEIQNVSRRTSIRIHPANLPIPQLNGCISLGEKICSPYGTETRGLLLSQPAVRRFETRLNKQPFILNVVNSY